MEGLDYLGTALDPTMGQPAGASAGPVLGGAMLCPEPCSGLLAVAPPPYEGPCHVLGAHPALCAARQKRGNSFLPFLLL